MMDSLWILMFVLLGFMLIYSWLQDCKTQAICEQHEEFIMKLWHSYLAAVQSILADMKQGCSHDPGRVPLDSPHEDPEINFNEGPDEE